MTNLAQIGTTGIAAMGIVAQSVGGGGGAAATGSAFGNSASQILTIGGAGAYGDGGNVSLVNSAAVTTAGRDAVALLAQSVGGGGGAAGMAAATTLGGGSGTGGAVSVTNNGTVATSGLRAFGILAQSVGGGGGFLSGGELFGANAVFATLSSGTGNGGSVTVKVNATGSVVTSGVDADGIIAQSLGGGGGFAGAGTLLTAAGTGSGFAGTAGGAGTGGAVKIIVDGSVGALGRGGIGLLAQSEGGAGYGDGAVTIAIAKNALVEGGSAGGSAIAFLQGSGETLTNAGTITSIQGASGTAVSGNSGGIAITNTGTINGSILLEGGGDAPSTVKNLAGLIDAGTLIDLGPDGVFTNSAMLAPGGEKIVSTTTLTGNYVQTGKGRLLITVALRNNTADALAVSGTASLAGFIVPTWINPKAARPGLQQVTILSATGGLTTQGLDGRHLSTPSVTATLVQPTANDLALDYVVNYTAAPSFRAAGMASANLQSVGSALQKIAGGEVPDALAPIMTSALNAPTAGALGAVYNGLSGEAAASTLQSAIGAIAQFQSTVMGQLGRLAASPASFRVASASDAIPVPAQSGPVRLWATGFGNADTLDGSGGTATLTSSTGGGAAGFDIRLGPGPAGGPDRRRQHHAMRHRRPRQQRHHQRRHRRLLWHVGHWSVLRPRRRQLQPPRHFRAARGAGRHAVRRRNRPFRHRRVRRRGGDRLAPADRPGHADALRFLAGDRAMAGRLLGSRTRHGRGRRTTRPARRWPGHDIGAADAGHSA